MGKRSSIVGRALERYRRCLTGPPGRRRPPYLPLFLPLHGQHALPALLAAAAQAALGVDPLEALGQYVANVGQVQQEQRHAHDRVQYGRQFAAQRPRRHVTVTCETVRGKKIPFVSTRRVKARVCSIIMERRSDAKRASKGRS